MYLDYASAVLGKQVKYRQFYYSTKREKSELGRLVQKSRQRPSKNSKQKSTPMQRVHT